MNGLRIGRIGDLFLKMKTKLFIFFFLQEHFADTDTDDEPTQNTGNSWFMDFD